ncbi:adenosine deaminase AGSA-like [Contarinia nasturtii]|uniref:adenosine deaminase AGSA-like n=1 Tax=Contarinia nasturtii TaxID=265458 RepID=UPI0012D42DA9|nr:adenosine deaminase AGSA-like [Contarinia nasturtii]
MNKLIARIICLGLIVHSIESNFVDLTQYYRQRNDLLISEMNSSFGNDINLTEIEKVANKIIMKAKEDELKVGLINPHLFNPSRHIFEVLDIVKNSKLFQIIKKMPKGGLLYVHEKTMCSADYLVSLTYWPNLWQLSTNNSEIETFQFARQKPQKLQSKNDEWRLVADVRAEMGASNYDQYVRKVFTLFDKNIDPRIQFRDVNEVWNRFANIFIKITPLLSYAPIFKEYLKHAFKEFQNDGIQYAEIRSSFPKLYDLDGNIYSEMAIFDVYQQVLVEFKRKNPLFIGYKIIYAPGKYKVANETIAQQYFDLARQSHEKYPHILRGFDLVGQEDRTPGLLLVAKQILQLPADLNLFFHAGETNWFGSVDENLFDTILMGSRRIGHGYALTKHPKLMEFVKRNNIAVEVNPISNQVLKLVDDYRNHPASVLIAQNVPIIISSDDPGFWEVSPLSHDFYMTFLGIASRHSDLRTLKKLAINSIQYSSLNDMEKTTAFTKWQIKWDQFIIDLVEQTF